ncbi:uncharacterized protein LOC119267603 isoform X3 [Triticum dicoccoides]|uniref:uncharacterized protein LOC119267603 isoform X3 n=1 Tax=Triticum dicoccoides TaxID=85692 RepID=UPI00188EEC9F|nr:uncharacterized protein LOC119267603 isoform X3 [Triticum dicoccoides]
MAALSLLLSGRCACCAPHALVLRVLRRPCICPASAHVVRPVRTAAQVKGDREVRDYYIFLLLISPQNLRWTKRLRC